mmetsp:Transcript_8730/g.18336  ORF Transcript_8730/g.18336 Transcript_8730/m.18336 type:complete len:310 (+) Transcript_8730:63-992(+)
MKIICDHEMNHPNFDSHAKREVLPTTRDQKSKATISIHVAPSASERNDRRAVRSRTRRERPLKIRLRGDGNSDETEPKDNHQRMNFFEPDVESFVSCCVHGVSFPTMHASKNQGGGSSSDNSILAQRRAKLIRKRSLPLLAFLSSTSLAAAEKKRRREERERQEVIAEGEARRIAAIDYSGVCGDEGNDTDAKPTIQNALLEERKFQNEENRIKLPSTSSAAAASRENSHVTNSECKKESLTAPLEDSELKPTKTTTITMESTSTVLMPPLLENFLSSLKRVPRQKVEREKASYCNIIHETLREDEMFT